MLFVYVYSSISFIFVFSISLCLSFTLGPFPFWSDDIVRWPKGYLIFYLTFLFAFSFSCPPFSDSYGALLLQTNLTQIFLLLFLFLATFFLYSLTRLGWWESIPIQRHHIIMEIDRGNPRKNTNVLLCWEY